MPPRSFLVTGVAPSPRLIASSPNINSNNTLPRLSTRYRFDAMLSQATPCF
jgi:hypothetical protein